MMKFKTTEDIKVPKKLIDQVIGQDRAVEIIKKAAKQRRHVLLIGEPGTGKSMLGMALAQLLQKEKLVDILAYPNPHDENKPLIRTVPAGKGREIVLRAKLEGISSFKNQQVIMFILLIIAVVSPWWAFNYYKQLFSAIVGSIMFSSMFLGGMLFLVSFMVFMSLTKKSGKNISPPKLIVDNYGKKEGPFLDATGAHAGALLGDVLHDPFQSGGLGTPAHERVVAGMIHKAHLGVLFIDEIATLDPATQQELLTALQEGKYPITGQSERSAGAMVRTEPVPCKFILVAAGNLETLKKMHPALRSRIRGYGYEVYMDGTMQDTEENRNKIVRFVAQEVVKDKKIPHFTKEAVDEIIKESRQMANRKNHLTLRFRELGGLVRAAGDVAVEEHSKYVKREHVIKAKKIARTLEKQIADEYIERKKEYEVIKVKGKEIGRVNGLAVIGSGNSYSGIMLPIEAEVTESSKDQGSVIATGKLGKIAKEAVINVSALIKKYFGQELKKKDIFIQFLQTYEGVEGDSASIAIGTAIISSLTKVPIRQDVAMTGSLSIKGEALPVGGVSSKVEAAIESGIKEVIIPKSNLKDVIIEEKEIKKIKLVPVSNFIEVLEESLDWTNNRSLLKKVKSIKKKKE